MQIKNFKELSFEIVENAIELVVIENLTSKLSRINLDKNVKQRSSVAFGVRNLLNVAPFIKEFANSDSVRKIIEPIVGKKRTGCAGNLF